MTAREFDRGTLADSTVVALIPATEDYAWAAAQAWLVAREATRGKPRVALVDLSLNMPMLDHGAVRRTDEGIVDALLYDTSLTRIAQPQDQPGLHYLGVGTPTDKPEEVWGHPRWSRLAAGFRSQEAVLLLFLPTAAIRHTSLRPDGIIILAPGGWHPAEGLYSDISLWLDEGIPLLAVLSDPDVETPAAGGAPAVAPRHNSLLLPPRRWGRSNRMFAMAFGLIVLGAAIWTATLLSRSPAAESTFVAPVQPPPSQPSREVGAGQTPLAPPRLDSLSYSLQVAAFNTLDRAVEYAVALETPRLVAAVTPIRIRGMIWYRVILGALPTAAEAEATLVGLWQDGLVESGEGAILRTPQAFDLGIRESDSAWEETQLLRKRGIPAYSVEASLGTARIFVGAFETPDQAAVVESLLTAAGLTATLITRTGSAR